LPHGIDWPHDKELPHGKDHGRTAESSRTAAQRTHDKGFCRAEVAIRAAMMTLPSEPLSAGRCRATSHDKPFDGQIGCFAVQFVAWQRAVFP
jgi:hypothetical protein